MQYALTDVKRKAVAIASTFGQELVELRSITENESVNYKDFTLECTDDLSNLSKFMEHLSPNWLNLMYKTKLAIQIKIEAICDFKSSH
ncbi:unnamed protein product [Protopolystoma xenopodis]|uniref:Uncharacterized protein n=1 Tax=Protopolystoma xenopodis TaxID=117903 RepID=A0A3S5CV03_9PLAT|nr:unnamed protein product [Protopolystoma xenopodis]